MAHRKGDGWTKERDAALRAMVSEGISIRAIARELDVSHSLVSRRMRRLDLKPVAAAAKAPEHVPPFRAPQHVQSFKAARRGFVVPAYLELQYYDLLKTGVPIAEACRRLGIAK